MPEIDVDRALAAVRTWVFANRKSLNGGGAARRPKDGWSGNFDPLILTPKAFHQALVDAGLAPKQSYTPSLESLEVERVLRDAGWLLPREHRIIAGVLVQNAVAFAKRP